jgi:hypothetical protein
MKKLLLLILLLSQGAYANCWNKAAYYYHVDPYLLYAIANVGWRLLILRPQILPTGCGHSLTARWRKR